MTGYHQRSILALIKYVQDVQVAGLLRDVALFGVVRIKPSVCGVLDHQTLPCFCLDVRLLHHLAIVGWECAHQHRQLAR